MWGTFVLVLLSVRNLCFSVIFTLFRGGVQKIVWFPLKFLLLCLMFTTTVEKKKIISFFSKRGQEKRCYLFCFLKKKNWNIIRFSMKLSTSKLFYKFFFFPSKGLFAYAIYHGEKYQLHQLHCFWNFLKISNFCPK